ncbi:uncharacterized protein PGTG_19513 [Puccinia graminis f. sp. tritici CRL 75-36-700-3]|uniref:Uncharacterized protein n=1 Tax=Puccinia graminis f. sp. tritici (strain CRL 75-36-700-3 / race SCCL) TaxID=418459 RepID=E3LAI4_PUCGT|nr:uncharacterized protein PGTG_19513 [Puccinia graminis f. sp. tritici CRL 75-36-700-3]EFP93559.1 hypothetical protein PGTG_19513 [Puccinia graminis f. sp. tritici CRL 75-36-700-3]
MDLSWRLDLRWRLYYYYYFLLGGDGLFGMWAAEPIFVLKRRRGSRAEEMKKILGLAGWLAGWVEGCVQIVEADELVSVVFRRLLA